MTRFGFFKHYKPARVIKKVVVLVVIFTGITASVLYAQITYQPLFRNQYPLSPLTNTCGVCHSAGVTVADQYALDWQAAGSNDSAFTTIEGQDSDGDGFANLEEIMGGSYPGNPDSYPTETAS